MTTLYLIRHSEQLRENGVNNIEDNSQIINEKIILSVEGEEKAKKISEIEELNNIDILWSSSYVRAKATAKYIAYKNNIDINIDSRLNERKLGNLDELKKLGNIYKHTFAEEQLLDSRLKNIDGENRLEVNKRMTNCINEIILNNENKKISIVSHGAAMRFYLMNYCTLNEDIKLVYKDKILDFSSPSIIKLTFDKLDLVNIENVQFND